ncbi:MAG: mannose-1-phosphate guanylyltransferase [Negativicutes bacterium]|jgi:mannose-1-phosphate guanylyltransferase/mannose-6-phosphate isomerase
MKAIILCGGCGTRLWPESTLKQPKQFLKIHSDNTLLAETVLRLLPIMRAEDMVILTGEAYRAQVVAELANIGCEAAHIVCEPCARNTAPAIALGAAYIKEKLAVEDGETIFVAPSDHIISNRREFYHYLRLAESLAQSGWFVTFGVVPDYPETGYGYIEAGEELNIGYSVSCFKEKPTRAVAAEYVEAGNYYWNAGMFLFTINSFFIELSKHAGDVAAYFIDGFDSAMRNFADIPKISIDYAVAERTDKAAVVPFSVGWNDVGHWDSVYDISGKDDKDNVLRGDIKCLDCSGVMVRANSRIVAVAGLSDVIVVETADSVLVIKRGKSQLVKGLL